jgi:large subunit ribosomal protein L35
MLDRRTRVALAAMALAQRLAAAARPLAGARPAGAGARRLGDRRAPAPFGATSFAAWHRSRAWVLLYSPVAMPKMKTHSGAKKRFKLTATGKVRGRHSFTSHILEKKSPKRKRRLGRPAEISAHDEKRVKVLLGA